MNIKKLYGAHTALVTPFFNGAVDYPSLEKLVEHQIKGGIASIVAVGTTGESPTLSHDEHISVVRFIVERARGRVPVIAGAGSNSTDEAVDLSLRAIKAGADALLSVGPYYNKPNAEGQYQHFAAIARAAGKTPIILYSIPGRCGVDIPLPAIVRLAKDFKNIVGIKESGGSCDRVSQMRQALGDSFLILSGDDSLTLPFMSVGAKGVVSVATNLYVRDIVKMVDLALKNDFRAAGKLFEKYYPLFKDLFIEPNPVPAKVGLVKLGLIREDTVRLPLAAAAGATCERIEALVKTLGKAR